MMRRSGGASLLPRWAPVHWLAQTWPSLLAAAVILGPVVATDRTFGGDWPLHLWLVEVQHRAIEQTGLPSLFGSFAPVGLFYPVGTFFGGTLYGLGGYVAVLTDAATGLAFLQALGVTAALVGWWQLGRVAGVRGLARNAPGLAHVTGAYFAGDMLGRGGVSSTVAVAMLPLALGSAAAVLDPAPRRWRAAWVLVAGCATCLMVSSHTISAMWSLTFAALLIPFGAAAHWGALWARPKRAAALLAAAVGGGMIAGWQLVPAATLAGRTRQALHAPFIPQWGEWYARPSVWLDPLRALPPEQSADAPYANLPVVLLAWIVVALVVWRPPPLGHRGLPAPWGWAAAVCLVTTLLAAAWQGLYDLLPSVYRATQFSIRLNHYVLLAVAGTLVVALAARERTERSAVTRTVSAALVAVMAFSVGLTLWQVWTTPSRYSESRSALVQGDDVSRFWYDTDQLGDTRLPAWAGPGLTHVAAAVPVAGRTTFTVDGRDLRRGIGVLVQAPPELIVVDGAEPVAVSDHDMVLRRVSAPDGPQPVTIAGASGGIVLAGRVVTLIGALMLALAVAWTALLDREAPRGAVIPRKYR